MRPFHCLMFVLLILCVSRTTFAQPLSAHTKSIESVVANCDRILVGRILKLESQTVNGPSLNRKIGSPVNQIVISIEKTITRPLRELASPSSMSIPVRIPRETLNQWQNASQRLLFALDHEDETNSKIYLLGPDNTCLLTANGNLIRQPDEVVRLATKLVKRKSLAVKRRHTFNRRVEKEWVADTDWARYYETGGGLLLEVPADENLELNAQRWMNDPSAIRREEGARAIRYFQTKENIERLKILLLDPGETYRQPATKQAPGEVVYGVRSSAYETLKSWGISVPQPAIRKRLPRLNEKPASKKNTNAGNNTASNPHLNEKA